MKLLPEEADTVIDYHERTKHHLDRYAAGPSGLDWADQPEPFRRFNGCEVISLPRPGTDLPVRFTELEHADRNSIQPVSRENLGLLLELAFGLSAWKQYGAERWALRCNPSSGNLHPTEAYVVITDAALLPPGVYHYVSYDHALEKRCQFSPEPPVSGFYVALTSISWREAWKYGERAYRYCQHDVGHALGALRYAAAALGWSLELMAECGDDELEQLLGLDRINDFRVGEGECPDLLCRIHAASNSEQLANIKALLKAAKNAAWSGQAERLSAFHHNQWPVIDQVALAARKPHSEEPVFRENSRPLPDSACALTASGLIRQRRSAQRFDAMTFMPHADFIRLLNAVLPSSRIPFDVWRWPPCAHLLLFVHRVEKLEPGLYLLPRQPDSVNSLQAAMRREFGWQAVEPDSRGAPLLYRLLVANCRRAAKTVSCHQDIASDGAVSIAMLAEFQRPLGAAPWHYRRLFWETGLIGQILYLEAEAAGMRGTGIGCFFDDSVHEILGLTDRQFQSLYHFTIGRPLDDPRLQTLTAYGHL